jgi:hypothetical protein
MCHWVSGSQSFEGVWCVFRVKQSGNCHVGRNVLCYIGVVVAVQFHKTSGATHSVTSQNSWNISSTAVRTSGLIHKRHLWVGGGGGGVFTTVGCSSKFKNIR